MKRSQTAFVIIAFIVLVVTVYSLIAGLSFSSSLEVEGSGGVVDLSGVDFKNEVVRTDAWQHYPGVLLEPGEIAGYTEGSVKQTSNVGTFRIKLTLPANDVYTIRFHSIEGVTRVFINGRSAEVVGDLSIYSRGAISKSMGLEYVVFSEQRQIEVVIQYLDVSAVPLDENPLTIGLQRNMQTILTRTYFYSFAVFGTLIAAFVIHLGLFLFHQQLGANLSFSLTCLVLAVRYGLAGELLFNNLFPNITWQFSYLIHHFTIVLLVLLVVSFIESFFSFNYYRWMRFVLYVLTALFTVSVFFLKPAAYTTASFYFQFAFVVYLIYTVIRQLVRIKTMESEQIMALVGIVTFLVGFAYDIDSFTTNWRLLERIPIFSILMMMLTVFLEIAALFFQFMKIEKTVTAMRKVERELAEENKLLQHLNDLKTNFLSSISHEVRTPLTVMSGYAQITKLGLPPELADGDAAKNLDLIMEEADRLSGMVSQLLLIARGEETKRERADVAAESIITRAIHMMTPVVSGRGNTLRRRIQRGLPAVRVNADAIYQVLLNLITNANRYASDSVILITAQVQGKRVVISVQDHGTGIAAEDLDRVFERYYTVMESPNPKESSGLGLPICRAIVEEHGGTIRIESAPGVGTTISFDLETELEDE